jgi:hypothetical protein
VRHANFHDKKTKRKVKMSGHYKLATNCLGFCVKAVLHCALLTH